MKTVALKELVASTILSFCENLAELGCPQEEKNPDMWYRYLSPKERVKVASKLLDIQERDLKRFSKESDRLHKETTKFINTVENAHKKTKKSKLRFGTVVECDRLCSDHKCEERKCIHRKPHKFTNACVVNRNEEGEAWCVSPGTVSPLDGNEDGSVVKCVPLKKVGK